MKARLDIFVEKMPKIVGSVSICYYLIKYFQAHAGSTFLPNPPD